MTNQRRAAETIRQINAFVDAVLGLFPEWERNTILNMPIDVLLTNLKARIETIEAEIQENSSLRKNIFALMKKIFND